MTTHWRSDQRYIIASHNGVTVSVAAPVRGQYTDSRLWLRLFRQSVAEASLMLAEKQLKTVKAAARISHEEYGVAYKNMADR